MNAISRLSALLRGDSARTTEERNARHLILSGAFLGFYDGGIMTYLPVWLARLGATPAMMGLLASGPQLMSMLALLPAGAFAERRQDLVRLANQVALIHRTFCILMAALPLFLTNEQIPFVAIALWTLSAIPSSIHMPAMMAVIHQAVPPQRRPAVNATRWGLYCIIGAIVIPAVGVMTDRVSFPTGYQLAFLLTFIGTLPNMYFFGKIIVPPLKRGRAEGAGRQPLLARLRGFVSPFVESKPFVRFVVATAMFRVCLSMPAGLFSIFWVDNLQAPDTWIGIRGAAAYASLVLGYWIFGKITHRIGHRNLLYLSALIGFYPIVTALSPSVEWLIPAAIIWGVSVAAIDIGFVDILLLACPEGRQPTFIAAANVLSSLELFIGPLIGAVIAQTVGVPQALLVSGVLQLVSAVFFLLLPSREQEEAEHNAHTQAALRS